MLTITSTELKNHIGKYIQLAEREEIAVTKHGKVTFVMVPATKKDLEQWESFFGTLPADASIGTDPNERG